MQISNNLFLTVFGNRNAPDIEHNLIFKELQLQTFIQILETFSSLFKSTLLLRHHLHHGKLSQNITVFIFITLY